MSCELGKGERRSEGTPLALSENLITEISREHDILTGVLHEVSGFLGALENTPGWQTSQTLAFEVEFDAIRDKLTELEIKLSHARCRSLSGMAAKARMLLRHMEDDAGDLTSTLVVSLCNDVIYTAEEMRSVMLKS